MMSLGIVAASFGGVMLLGGVGAAAMVSCEDTEPPNCWHPETKLGTGLLIAGGALAAIGIPLAIVGGIRVPVEPEPNDEVAVKLSPGGISLTF